MTRKSIRVVVVVAVALLVLISATAYFINLYRDSIALEVARTALRDSELQVRDVSVESISSNEVRFDTIVLELADGGSILIEGITLPVRFRGLRNSRLHIERITFLPGTADAGPVRLAAGLQNFLDAPAATPGATIRVDEVLLPDMPVIRDAAWHADQLNPTLRATVDTFELFVTTTQDSDGAFRGSVRALLPNDTEAVMLGYQLVPEQSGFEVRGTVSLTLEPLLPVLHATGAVPAEVTALASTLNGAFDFRLAADETLPVDIQAVFDTASGTTLTYQAEDTDIELSVIETAPMNALFQYPSLDWTAQVARSSLSLAGAGPDLPIFHLRDSECRSGITCRTALDFSYSDLVIGDLSIDAVAVKAGAVLLNSRDENWTVSSPDTEIMLNDPVLAGRHIVAPAIAADVSASNERVSAEVDFGTPESGLTGRAALSHDLATEAGELTLESATVEFDLLHLSEMFTEWPYDWDVTAGRGSAEADIRWTAKDSGFTYTGSAAVSADSLAGRYADIGFLGASGRLEIEMDSAAPLTLEPARFDVALVDIGFPVEDISGTATPHIDESVVEVSSLSMTVLGGTVTADPFRYDLNAGSNELMLRASNVQLPLMVGLADLEAVTISGSVSGEIPVTIRGNNVIIDEGFLENDPPGGVIQYLGGAANGVVDDTSQLGIVTRTLRNLEFDSLTSAVNYSEDGDLVLQMRLKGINPDVDPTQPVILNLNVENNVPQMLRSLQATRSIEDVLERRLSN
jgi:hypothetical protein